MRLFSLVPPKARVARLSRSATSAEDRARRHDLEAAGYLELRFSNEDIAERLHWVLHEIRRALVVARGGPIPEALFQMETLEKRNES